MCNDYFETHLFAAIGRVCITRCVKINSEHRMNIATATVFILLLTSTSSRPVTKIIDSRIWRLIRQIFYIPPSGEPYFNGSVPLSASSMCSDVCVPFHLCVNGNVVTNGANLFAPRMGLDDDEVDGPQQCSESEKCCKLSYEDSKSDMNSEEEFGADEITDDYMERTEYDDNNLDFGDTRQRKCGIRNFNMLQPRISGDDKAGFLEFPWMVMVLRRMPKRSDFYDYQCGGSLIHPSVVLTAAHCVNKMSPKTLHIRAGEWDMERTDEILPHQDREVRSVIIHQDYYKPTLLNDVALLLLKTPVLLAENVNTICLPPPNYSFSKERCVVSGWGKENHSRDSKFQTVLKKVDLPVIPNFLCQMLFRNTVLGKYFRLDSSFICAGGEYGKDTCQGDGGSPMVCKIPNTRNAYYQSGIVSWGVGCSEKNIP